jgi:crotonobetainyl-CoA:carnitine CoA-transferase CaiB-like acyl-CoA transferase
MSHALSGLRILDLADRSAALGGRILADLGAEVILVESPDGNSIRRMAPFLDDEPGTERSFHHQYLSANKKSVVIEGKAHPFDGHEFEALVASADLLIDTARPGSRAGLEHANLLQLNPKLIQISVTPFGLSDLLGRKANDLIAGAAGGLVWVSGERRGTPVQGGASPSYCMAGLATASAATIALHERRGEHVGAGVHIDLSLQEATLMAVMQTATPTHWTWHGRIPHRPGLSGALRCKDGRYVGFLVRPDRFEKFLHWCDQGAVDHQMTPDDWRWSRLDAPRKDNPVSEAILELSRTLTRDEFVAGALEADIVCMPVFDFDDVDGHDQFTQNDQFIRVEQPSLKRGLGFVRSPVEGISGGIEIRCAPTLGEHDDEILGEIRGRRLGNRPGSRSASRPRPAIGSATERTPQRTKSPQPEEALSGLRVIDFGWVLAGPIGSRLLASFGAEVIRIESSHRPDSMRSQLGPDGRPDSDLGGLFNSVNAGKKSLAVDVSTEAGRKIVKALVAKADLVLNNFRPGALDRMGLGYEVLKAIKSDIILLNLPGAHPSGPWAGRASMGNILMAASGFNMLTGFEGEVPRGIGVAYPDFVSPHLMVASVLAALRERERTGRGQEIQAVQLSGMLSLLGVEWMHYRATGKQPPRNANRNPNECPHGVYPANGEDQWVAIAVANDREWQALCDVMDRPELARDPRFETHRARKENEDAVDEFLRTWTATREKWDCAARLQKIGIAAAPVEDLRDLYERDPVTKDHYQIVKQPTSPDVDIPIDREAARWIGCDHRLRRSPGIGEHNEEILKGLLGVSDQEFVELMLAKVLE